MSLYGKVDQANNAPKYRITEKTDARGNTMFANVTIGATIPSVAVGVIGVDASEMSAKKATHAGWVKQTIGTGACLSLDITAGGTLYSNTYFIRVTATGANSVNATANLTTDSNGTIISYSNLVGGVFTSKTATVAVVGANGTGATITANIGGRAGRVSYETLVAMGSMTGSGSSLS